MEDDKPLADMWHECIVCKEPVFNPVLLKCAHHWACERDILHKGFKTVANCPACLDAWKRYRHSEKRLVAMSPNEITLAFARWKSIPGMICDDDYRHYASPLAKINARDALEKINRNGLPPPLPEFWRYMEEYNNLDWISPSLPETRNPVMFVWLKRTVEMFGLFRNPEYARVGKLLREKYPPNKDDEKIHAFHPDLWKSLGISEKDLSKEDKREMALKLIDIGESHPLIEPFIRESCWGNPIIFTTQMKALVSSLSLDIRETFFNAVKKEEAKVLLDSLPRGFAYVCPDLQEWGYKDPVSQKIVNKAFKHANDSFFNDMAWQVPWKFEDMKKSHRTRLLKTLKERISREEFDDYTFHLASYTSHPKVLAKHLAKWNVSMPEKTRCDKFSEIKMEDFKNKGATDEQKTLLVHVWKQKGTWYENPCLWELEYDNWEKFHTRNLSKFNLNPPKGYLDCESKRKQVMHQVCVWLNESALEATQVYALLHDLDANELWWHAIEHGYYENIQHLKGADWMPLIYFDRPVEASEERRKCFKKVWKHVHTTIYNMAVNYRFEYGVRDDVCVDSRISWDEVAEWLNDERHTNKELMLSTLSESKYCSTILSLNQYSPSSATIEGCRPFKKEVFLPHTRHFGPDVALSAQKYLAQVWNVPVLDLSLESTKVVAKKRGLPKSFWTEDLDTGVFVEGFNGVNSDLFEGLEISEEKHLAILQHTNPSVDRALYIIINPECFMRAVRAGTFGLDVDHDKKNVPDDTVLQHRHRDGWNLERGASEFFKKYTLGEEQEQEILDMATKDPLTVGRLASLDLKHGYCDRKVAFAFILNALGGDPHVNSELLGNHDYLGYVKHHEKLTADQWDAIARKTRQLEWMSSWISPKCLREMVVANPSLIHILNDDAAMTLYPEDIFQGSPEWQFKLWMRRNDTHGYVDYETKDVKGVKYIDVVLKTNNPKTVEFMVKNFDLGLPEERAGHLARLTATHWTSLALWEAIAINDPSVFVETLKPLPPTTRADIAYPLIAPNTSAFRCFCASGQVEHLVPLLPDESFERCQYTYDNGVESRGIFWAVSIRSRRALLEQKRIQPDIVEEIFYVGGTAKELRDRYDMTPIQITRKLIEYCHSEIPDEYDRLIHVRKTFELAAQWKVSFVSLCVYTDLPRATVDWFLTHALYADNDSLRQSPEIDFAELKQIATDYDLPRTLETLVEHNSKKRPRWKDSDKWTPRKAFRVSVLDDDDESGGEEESRDGAFMNGDIDDTSSWGEIDDL